MEDGGIDVDSAGLAYVVGTTASNLDFPTTPNAFQVNAPPGIGDAFLTIIDPLLTGAASLVYSTYLGGSFSDQGTGVAVDLKGDAHVTGYTLSNDFPGPGGGAAPKLGLGGGQDVFLATIDRSMPGTGGLVDAAEIGGTSIDFAYGIATDVCGSVYLTGETGSPGYPLANPVQPTIGGGRDAFITKLGNPLAENCHGPDAYITHVSDVIVSAIDTATHSVVATVPVGKNTWGVAMHPDGSRAYVTSFVEDEVSVIDTLTNTVISTIPVGVNPIGIAAHPSGAWLYVANSSIDPNLSVHIVSVIDIATKAVAEVQLDAVTEANVPFGIAAHPDGTRVYLTNQQGDFVSVLSVNYSTNPLVTTPTHALVDTADVGQLPQGIAVNPLGNEVYVANADDGRVSVLSTVTNAVTDTIPLSPFALYRPYAVDVHPDGGRLYVSATTAGSGALWVIDLTQNPPTKKAVSVGLEARGVAVTPNGDHVYVANFGTDDVSVMQTSDDTVLPATIPVGNGPIALGRFIGPPDRDGDGIMDPVDGTFAGNIFTDESTVFSNNFTDEHIGGKSSGDIGTRDGLAVSVWDAFNPGGLWVRASGSGGGTAQINSQCIVNSVVQITDGDVGLITCASLGIQTIAGLIQVDLGAGGMVSVPQGVSAKIVDIPGGRHRVENAGNAGKVIVELADQTIELLPGRSIILPLVLCNGLAATMAGTPASDIIVGTPRDDVIVGLGGDDVVLGRGGNDVICGGPGDDVLMGGRGRDWIAGGVGNDVVLGGDGHDKRLAGDKGDDLARGGRGNDRLLGGRGDDGLFGGPGNDRLIAHSGADSVAGGPGDDTIRCGPGKDVANGGGLAPTLASDMSVKSAYPESGTVISWTSSHV